MKLQHIILTVALVAGAFIAGFLSGFSYQDSRASRSEMRAEFKVAHSTLKRTDTEPQLREYLKSRLYYLACQLEPRDLYGFDFDFGPVDERIGFSGIKGSETDAEVYQMAMARHQQNKK